MDLVVEVAAQNGQVQAPFGAEDLVQAAPVDTGGRDQVVHRSALVAVGSEDNGCVGDSLIRVEGAWSSHGRNRTQ
ncbi:hypothetical protein GCM10010372_81470 [Streptomyces tauricus]|nr:hypothetical protein GCM10010372_81470 [Streptomyces tauricus]